MKTPFWPVYFNINVGVMRVFTVSTRKGSDSWSDRVNRIDQNCDIFMWKFPWAVIRTIEQSCFSSPWMWMCEVVNILSITNEIFSQFSRISIMDAKDTSMVPTFFNCTLPPSNGQEDTLLSTNVRALRDFQPQFYFNFYWNHPKPLLVARCNANLSGLELSLTNGICNFAIKHDKTTLD